MDDNNSRGNWSSDNDIPPWERETTIKRAIKALTQPQNGSPLLVACFVGFCGVVAVILIFNFSGITFREATTPKSALSGVAKPTRTPGPVVATMDEFDALYTGMSYSQACAVIGSRGVEMSSNNIAGMKTIMYLWQNSDGSNMNAMFQNDGLISKAQFGLP